MACLLTHDPEKQLAASSVQLCALKILEATIYSYCPKKQLMPCFLVSLLRSPAMGPGSS